MYPYKLPNSEIIESPSLATFEPVQTNSVRTMLSEQEMKEIPTNGHTLESLREFSPLNRMDKIDKIGIATKMLSESASKYSRSGLRQQLYKKSPKTK